MSEQHSGARITTDGNDDNSKPFQQIEIIAKPKDISDEEKAQLNQLLEDLRLAFTWCVNLTAAMVRRKLASGELSSDDLAKQEQYRIKVMNYMITQRATAWLLPTISANVVSPFQKKLSDFTAKDLTSLLDQVRPPIPPAAQLVDALVQLGKQIHDGSLKEGPVHPIYWIAIARVFFDDNTRQFKAVLQTFNIQLTAEQHEESSGGLRPTKTLYVKITPALVGAQYDFNLKEFEHVKADVKKAIDETTGDAIHGTADLQGASQARGLAPAAETYFNDVPV